MATNSRPCPTNWAVSSGSPLTDRRTPSAEWPAGFCRRVAVSAVFNPSPTGLTGPSATRGNRDVQRSTHRRGVRGLESLGGEPKAFERAVGNVLVLAKLGHIDLTSLSQTSREQADRAVDAVVERLDRGRTEPVSSVLMPQLVVRGTTATPAGP